MTQAGFCILVLATPPRPEMAHGCSKHTAPADSRFPVAVAVLFSAERQHFTDTKDETAWEEVYPQLRIVKLLAFNITGSPVHHIYGLIIRCHGI